MSSRLLLALVLLGCSSSDSTGTASSSSSSSSSSGGDEPVDLNDKISATECKKRCADHLKDTCDESSTDANKNCNSICRETGTGHQIKCIEEDIACDDLTHEQTIVELCPTATK